MLFIAAFASPVKCSRHADVGVSVPSLPAAGNTVGAGTRRVQPPWPTRASRTRGNVQANDAPRGKPIAAGASTALTGRLDAHQASFRRRRKGILVDGFFDFALVAKLGQPGHRAAATTTERGKHARTVRKAADRARQAIEAKSKQ
jgi:hypothetical protein